MLDLAALHTIKTNPPFSYLSRFGRGQVEGHPELLALFFGGGEVEPLVRQVRFAARDGDDHVGVRVPTWREGIREEGGRKRGGIRGKRRGKKEGQKKGKDAWGGRLRFKNTLLLFR